MAWFDRLLGFGPKRRLAMQQEEEDAARADDFRKAQDWLGLYSPSKGFAPAQTDDYDFSIPEGTAGERGFAAGEKKFLAGRKEARKAVATDFFLNLPNLARILVANTGNELQGALADSGGLRERMHEIALDRDEREKERSFRFTLENLGYEHAKHLQDLRQTWEGLQNEANRTLTRGEGAADRAAASTRQAAQIASSEKIAGQDIASREREGTANRESEFTLTGIRERGANARTGAEIDARMRLWGQQQLATFVEGAARAPVDDATKFSVIEEGQRRFVEDNDLFFGPLVTLYGAGQKQAQLDTADLGDRQYALETARLSLALANAQNDINSIHPVDENNNPIPILDQARQGAPWAWDFLSKPTADPSTFNPAPTPETPQASPLLAQVRALAPDQREAYDADVAAQTPAQIAESTAKLLAQGVEPAAVRELLAPAVQRNSGAVGVLIRDVIEDGIRQFEAQRAQQAKQRKDREFQSNLDLRNQLDQRKLDLGIGSGGGIAFDFGGF